MKDLITEIVRRPHPILVHFPLSLFPMSTVFAVSYFITYNPIMLHVAYWCYISAAAIMLPILFTGALDFFRLKPHSEKAHRVLLIHVVNGIFIAVLSMVSGFIFIQNPPMVADNVLPVFMAFSFALTALVLMQGYIAARMVYRHKLGVDGETR